MKNVIHTAASRGHADHGWLQSKHSFSFAGYHDPKRMNFGVLRVLNDDTVAGGQGFGTHPHDNMEIISIPLEGDLEHKDSMGNTEVIKEGDIQAMSAGTGIFHSEYNKNADSTVKFLQIWIFPKTKNVTPRYDQQSLSALSKQNELYQVLSPNEGDAGVWIHQDPWFHMGDFQERTQVVYAMKKQGNGVYAFVLEGQFEINGETIEKRDGMGIWDTETLHLTSGPNSRILLMEVPMHV